MSQDGIELSAVCGASGSVERQPDFAFDVDSKNGVRQLLDALPAAVYTTDAAGRITFYNEVAAALWGRRPKLNTKSGAVHGACIGRTERRCRTTNARWRKY